MLDKDRNRPAKRYQVTGHLFSFLRAWYVLYTYILLKSCSRRQNLLKVARTAESCSKRQTLLKSCRAQSRQAYAPAHIQDFLRGPST